MSRYRVVICEDDPTTLTLLRRIIEKIPGTEVAGWPSVGQALLDIERSQPSLVVLDHMMPGATGLDGLKHLRSTPWGKGIPVLLYSASDIEEAAYREGATSFLRKPAPASHFLSRVKTLLGVTE